MAIQDPLRDIQPEMQPEEAVRRARVLATAMQGIPESTLLAMQSSVPELQQMGKAQFELAGRERGEARETGTKVLGLSLGKEQNDISRIAAQRELAALQQQIEYQRGQIGLQGQQLGLSILGPLIPHLLNAGINENSIKGFTELLGGSLGDKLNKVLGTRPIAERNAVLDILGKVGLPLEGAVNQPTTPALPGGHKKKPPAPPAAPTGPTDLVPVQIPGQPPGSIHRSQLEAFKLKYPTAELLGQ